MRWIARDEGFIWPGSQLAPNGFPYPPIPQGAWWVVLFVSEIAQVSDAVKPDDTLSFFFENDLDAKFEERKSGN